MSLRIYRLTTTTTASGVGLATATIVASGSVIGVQASAYGQGGAADGQYATEIALNNTSVNNAAVNSPQSESLLTKLYHTYDGGESDNVNVYFPMSKRVSAGNILSINQTLIGTASSAAFLVGFDVFVQE